MTDEALTRIAIHGEPAGRGYKAASDYLSEQAYEKVRKRLPAGFEQRLAFLRDTLQRPAPDREIEEFQTLVGHFVLGMTLEIGHTLQDETDRALDSLERIARLLAELEKIPAPAEGSLGGALFHAGMTERELRRIRALERKWKEASRADSPFAEFNLLKRNIRGDAADPDQWLVFELAERYRAPYPFVDEFLANYRRLAAGFRETARKVNALLPAFGE